MYSGSRTRIMRAPSQDSGSTNGSMGATQPQEGGSFNKGKASSLNSEALTDVLFHELKQPLLCVVVLAERLERHIDEIDPGTTSVHAPLKRDISALIGSVTQIRELLIAGTNFVNGRYIEHGWGEKMHRSWSAYSALCAARETLISLEGETLFDKNPSGPDPKLVNQIVGNLVLNGIEALEQNKAEKKEIFLEFCAEEHWLRFRVHDSGSGVPQESIEKVFERGHTTKSATGGSGIGLWLCKMIANSLGGSLVVGRSEKLGGACFELSLPKESQNHELGVVA